MFHYLEIIKNNCSSEEFEKFEQVENTFINYIFSKDNDVPISIPIQVTIAAKIIVRYNDL
jgi:hypothetical protein